jgi:hypothetical protein
MKIRKVGILEGSNVHLTADAGDFAALVTNYEISEDGVSVFFDIIIGQGPSARRIKLEIPLSKGIIDAQRDMPMNLAPDGSIREYESKYLAAIIFKDQIFLAADDFITNTFMEEAVLLVKKAVFEQDNKLKRLKTEVEAIERILSQTGLYKHSPIPEMVKLVVWERDEGKCVRCGSTQNLHFAHIIPVIKGGGNSEQNIQLLCADCNLEKSDKIAF